MRQKEFLNQQGEVDRLELLSTRTRKLLLDHIAKSKVGHPGGSLSVTDILTALYFGRFFDPEKKIWKRIMHYNPKDPLWPERDRMVLSKGHAAPAFYATLAQAGFFSEEILKIYKKIDSPLEGHPSMYQFIRQNHRLIERGTQGVDFSTGSLGHGLAIGAGFALYSKIYERGFDVFVILGDGEFQEGMVWEACMTIPNKKLNNLCAIIDKNGLQCDGKTDQINSLEPLDEKLRSFNWEVMSIDGHNFYDLIDAFGRFKGDRREKPLAVIANTIKGKGFPEIENNNKYHASPISLEQYERAEKILNGRIKALEDKVRINPPPDLRVAPLREKSGEIMKEQSLADIMKANPFHEGEYKEATATRIGYGNALHRLGKYRNIFVLNADLTNPCGTTKFVGAYAEDAEELTERRSMNVGIQECNMMSMGAAMASCGVIPVVNSFGVFSTGRAWEMVRQDVSYPRQNVKIIGSHTGIALGEYGVSHQSMEDIGAARALPNMTIIEPSDAIQADLLFEKVLQWEGPVYFRLGRNPTELIYGVNNLYDVPSIREFDIGKGYWLKHGSDMTLMGSGPIVIQALIVAQSVEESIGVIDMPTIVPIDENIIAEASQRSKKIVTLQDHFKNGGLKDEVAGVIALKSLKVEFDYVGLHDFTESGSAKDLYEKYGLSASSIIKRFNLTPRRI
jgi:transketolase